MLTNSEKQIVYYLAVYFVLQICLTDRFCMCAQERWIHKGNCQLNAQSSVPPIRILAVCRMGLGGIRSGKSSYFQEEQQVTSVKTGLQAAALAQTSEAWPHLWASHWCLQDVAIFEPCGIGSARKREIGVGAVFPTLRCREPMVQPARQSEEGLRSHHQVLIQARHDTLC